MSNFLVKDGDKASWQIPEGYPYNEQSINILFPENEYYIAETQDNLSVLELYQEPGTVFDIKASHIFSVTFDGKEYTCPLVWVHLPSSGSNAFGGNLALFGLGDDTGEPFAFKPISAYDELYGFYFVTNLFGNSHTISVGELTEIIYPIDPKYLPDSISTKDDIWVATNSKAILPSVKEWDAITYGKDKFIALEYNYNTSYSYDGINWIERSEFSPGRYATWTAIAYGNDRFVKIANNSQSSAYSYDGIKWFQSRLPSDNYWGSITYGNNMFIATTYNNTIAYSLDGIDWIQHTLPDSFYCQNITYGKDKFVIIGAINNIPSAAYSEDGINWSLTTIKDDSTFNFSEIVYGKNKFVAIGRKPVPSCAYSTDGINWTIISMPNIDCSDVGTLDYCLTYGNDKFVAIYSNLDNISYAIYSSNGINWNLVNIPYKGNFRWSAIAYGDNKFVVISKDSNVVVFSFDGIIWQTELKQITQGDANLTSDIIKILGINNKQDKLSGTESQYIGFDSNNNPIAKNFPIASSIPDVTAAPTAEEFNALLKSLRDAGILATS